MKKACCVRILFENVDKLKLNVYENVIFKTAFTTGENFIIVSLRLLFGDAIYEAVACIKVRYLTRI